MGLFWTHEEGDNSRISGNGVDIELSYRKVSGPRRHRKVLLKVKAGNSIRDVLLYDNERVALLEERGIYIRIAGYLDEGKKIRIHYIADKKYQIDFI